LRPCVLRLVEKVSQRPAQRILIEIPRTHDVETGRLQGLRDQAGIVRGCVERAGLIARIADHQRDPLLGRRVLRSDERRQDEC